LRVAASGNISDVMDEQHGDDRPPATAGEPGVHRQPSEAQPAPDVDEGPAEPREEPDVVAEGVFYAMFRLVEIDELSGPEKALDWARMVVEDEGYRRAFADNVRRAVAAR
jgi:hypothetical protein